MALFTYSARALKLVIDQSLIPSIINPIHHVISGYAPDEFLTIETEDDDWTTEEGADGFVVRSMIPNQIQKITLTLQQTSPTNDILTRLYTIGKGLDSTTAVGFDIFGFSVTPPLQATVGTKQKLYNASSCYISKIAPLTYSKESGTRAWEITAVGGIFGADTLSAVAQGVGGLTRDAFQLINTIA